MYIPNPFHIAIDPMKKLLLVNFEKDPDSLYVGFEPQEFDDHVNGKGYLVIGWRVDGRVDVYHEPGLTLDSGKYDIAGKGLANMLKREMPGAFFEVNDFGVQAYFVFQDIQNRDILIRISEKNPKKRKPFSLLAPMGDAAENPSAMPLVFLQDFYFVRKRNTEFKVSIQNKQHQTDEFPLLMDWTKMYFSRYSPRLLVATINPAFNGPLPQIETVVGAKIMHRESHEFILEWKQETPFIKCIIRHNSIQPVTLRFNESFPDIKRMANNSSLRGNFEIEAHPSSGKISGHYKVEKKDGVIKIVMIPSKGWQPKPTKLSLWFLFNVVKIFKKWPTTYEWTAHIQEREDGLYIMKSGWKRINK